MRTEIYAARLELSPEDAYTRVALHFETSPTGQRKAAVLAFNFYDENGESLDPLGKHHHAAWCGPYLYLNSRSETPTHFTHQFARPESAVEFEIKIYPWARNTEIEFLTEPSVVKASADLESTFQDHDGSPAAVPADELTLLYDVRAGVEYNMEWQIEPAPNAQALLRFRYLDGESNEMLPGTEFPVSPDHGAYRYAVDRDGIPLESVQMTVPEHVVRLEIKGMPWKGAGVQVLTRPTLDPVSSDGQTLTDAEVRSVLQAIPQDDKVVVVYTTAGPISLQNSLLLRSNRLALEYAAAGWHVIFFPFAELKHEDSEVVGERIHQFSRSRLSVVMDQLLSRQGANNVLLCSSFSDLSMVGLIDRCHDHSWRVIYEVRDDMEEFQRVGYSKWYDQNLEARFAKRADALLAVSPRLKSKMETITGRTDVQLVPNGAPDELIAAASTLRTPQAGEHRSAMRKVGYIGHLTASWFDWPWLIDSAQQHPDIVFEIIGHGMPKEIALPPNVEYLGAMNHTECLPYAKDWSAGLVPFKISRLTYGVDPNKAYEYVAMGMRTVSAPMGQVADMPGAIVYTSQAEMASAIRWCVDNPISGEDIEAFNKYLETASWSARSRSMIKILEG